MPTKVRLFWGLLGFISIAFHLGLIFSGLVPNLISRPLHMALALPWALVFIARTPLQRVSGIILTLAGGAATVWVAFNQSALSDQYGFLSGDFQLVLAITLLVTVLEMARRSIGWPLPVVAALALAYGLFGQHIPGEFGHPGTPLNSFLGTLTIAEGGLWGSLTAVSVNIVAIFVIFGAVLNAGEAGQGFMNVAAAAAGRLKGGAAKVSVIASALFGSISGSASANVASTGAITLPTMTRLGYPKALAGAVEAVASSGGQIMPPLMGAGAFVMVELTGTPYTGIMAAALLPALLYFIAVWIGIDGFSTRYELRGLSAEERPSAQDVLITSAFFMVPFSVLLWGIFIGDFTPQYAACLAILAGVLLLPFDARLKLDIRRTAERVLDACISAGSQIAMIGAIILCASIVIGVLGITGLGVKITSVILSGSGGMLWPALSVAGPALISLGLEPLLAHLFVFWFALLSTITPPVCGAVFIAAGIVGENWLKVAIFAMALGLGLYLIPLGMVANRDLVALADAPLSALFAMLKVGVGIALISNGVITPKVWFLRAGLVVAGGVVVFAPVSI